MLWRGGRGRRLRIDLGGNREVTGNLVLRDFRREMVVDPNYRGLKKGWRMRK